MMKLNRYVKNIDRKYYAMLYRQKLAQLEEEQAKKSTSNTNDESPKASRNNAIKRLLIKNLKLAAMIASKEIQLEEARGRTLDCKTCVYQTALSTFLVVIIKCRIIQF